MTGRCTQVDPAVLVDQVDQEAPTARRLTNSTVARLARALEVQAARAVSAVVADALVEAEPVDAAAFRVDAAELAQAPRTTAIHLGTPAGIAACGSTPTSH